MKGLAVRELRSVQRYSVRLPVSVTFRTPGAPDSRLNAFTRDISTRGMFVVADASAANGDLVEFELDLALEEAALVVQGKGRVVRIERTAGQPAGFAVHNVWYRFKEPDLGGALPHDWQAFAATGPLPAPITFRRPRHWRLAMVPFSDSDQGEF